MGDPTTPPLSLPRKVLSRGQRDVDGLEVVSPAVSGRPILPLSPFPWREWPSLPGGRAAASFCPLMASASSLLAFRVRAVPLSFSAMTGPSISLQIREQNRQEVKSAGPQSQLLASVIAEQSRSPVGIAGWHWHRGHQAWWLSACACAALSQPSSAPALGSGGHEQAGWRGPDGKFSPRLWVREGEAPSCTFLVPTRQAWKV